MKNLIREITSPNYLVQHEDQAMVQSLNWSIAMNNSNDEKSTHAL
jgi:hypothetical protein